MTPYEIASAKYDIAIAAYYAALSAHKAGGSNEDLIKAQAAKKIADAEFDIAFNIASELPEETADDEIVEANENQLSFSL